jgi:hypothetical protein
MEHVVLDADAVQEDPEVEPGPYAALRVADTGTGMDRATQRRVFEPFFTTKAKGRAVGLGLATVYGIVKQSGGHVTLDSVAGRGSTFAVYLPAVREPAREVAAPSASPMAPGRGETILVVDDNADVRQVVCAVLRKLDYSVIEAAGGTEALAASAAHRARSISSSRTC